ncbi:MAG TPA: S9 family peptidase [Mycobacteriales bacterium]|nr:S9 family peptidase [Mycobacteriales bacterium]
MTDPDRPVTIPADRTGAQSASPTQPTADQHGPFHDLAEYVGIRRLSGLAVSPDGIRLVTAVAELSPDGKRYCTSLWEVDPGGQRPARRLTRSAPGEAHPVFLPDGRLLFASRRPDAEAKPEEDAEDRAALWLLPEAGEARPVARRPGSVGEVAVARDSGDVVFTAAALPGTATPEEDEARRKTRKDAGVTAILHERHPVRYWDHDLGPTESHVLAAGQVPMGDGWLPEVRDLTPTAEGRVHEGLAVSPDGRLLAVGWRVDDAPAATRPSLALIDTATGERRLVEEEGTAFSGPVFSPDSRRLACVQERLGDWETPPHCTLRLVDLATGHSRDLLPGTTLWPSGPVFSVDGAQLYFVADDRGHAPAFRLDLTSGQLTRLTASGAYTDLVVAPDGSTLYALRSAMDSPPRPVRIDPTRSEQDPVRLLSPAEDLPLPGSLTELLTSADDGVAVRAWLALPRGASADRPAPLVLWIHGGPLRSWNAWSWRWNPWLMVARGYAVLLPDPALSTGYGTEFIRRGWGAWGGRPFTDLMAATDAAITRADIDGSRTAAMGGSFGGYLANWVATQTDRFRAIVTHASLWHLDAFAGTTDEPSYWYREFGDPLEKQERYLENSPHLRAESIRTPMLVVHGDRDYRVPIGEALRLWYDLGRFRVPAKFLYFPDENHWVLAPGHARVWYETVLAFLAEHVLGQPWRRPDLL